MAPTPTSEFFWRSSPAVALTEPLPALLAGPLLTARPLRRFYRYATRTSRIAWFDDDLDVTPQRSKEVHKPLDGESLEAILQQGGHFRLINSEDLGGLNLRIAAGSDLPMDGDRQMDFGVSLRGIRYAQIIKYIARACADSRSPSSRASRSFAHSAPLPAAIAC